MSVRELERVATSLAGRPVGMDEVRELSQAIGGSLSPNEAAILGQLVDERPDAFDRESRSAMEALMGQPWPSTRPVGLEVRERHFSNVEEQSGLTFLSDELGFLTVDDATSTVFRIPVPKDSATKITPEVVGRIPETRGLEGITFDRERSSILVVSENDRTVTEVPLEMNGESLALGRARKLGKLPRLGRVHNKGYEGIAILPSDKTLDRRPRILVVHEASPKAIAVLDRDNLGLEATVMFPKIMEDAMIDVSDVAVDPKSRHLLILSDESRIIFEADLVALPPLLGRGAYALIPIGKTKLPGSTTRARLQPEGLAVDSRGDVWVASEGDQSLIHLARRKDDPVS